MPYNKTTWAKGDVVTSAKLNNMEDGIASIDSAQSSAFAPDITSPQGGEILIYDSTLGKWVNYDPSNNDFVVTCTITGTDFSGTTDVTRQQITDAYNAHKNIILKISQYGMDTYATPYCYNVIGITDKYVQLLWFITYSSGTSYFLVRGYTDVDDASTATYSCEMFTLTEYTPSI